MSLVFHCSPDSLSANSKQPHDAHDLADVFLLHPALKPAVAALLLDQRFQSRTESVLANAGD
jgi:hypothetical protein